MAEPLPLTDAEIAEAVKHSGHPTTCRGLRALVPRLAAELRACREAIADFMRPLDPAESPSAYWARQTLAHNRLRALARPEPKEEHR